MSRFLRLSVSRCKTFDQCRFKYHCQYIRKLPTEIKVYNAIGSLVHLILEIAFKKWIKTGYVRDLKELIILAWKQSRETKEWLDAVQFDVIDEAKYYILSYYNDYIKNSSGKPIKCEANFRLPLEISKDLKAEIIGYIDRIDQLDYKTLYVLDYKTTNKVQYLDNFQLGVYTASCLHGPYRGYNIKAAYVLLKHGMKLKKMQNPNDNYMKELDKIVVIARQMDEAINFTKEFPPSFSKLCDYCDFKDVCYKETGGPNKFRRISIGADSW